MNILHILNNYYKGEYEEYLWKKLLNIYCLSFPIDREVFLHAVVVLPLSLPIYMVKARFFFKVIFLCYSHLDSLFQQAC